MRFPDEYDDEPRGPRRSDPYADSAPIPTDFGRVIPEDFGGGGAPVADEEIPDFGSFEIPSYTGPWAPQMNFGPAPQFSAGRFGAPSLEQAMAEPGYQFRLASGVKALDASAAARGSLRTGGHNINLLEYGQNFGEQAYADNYARALQTFLANEDQRWRAYQPQLEAYLMQSGASRDAALAAYNGGLSIYNTSVQAALERERLAQQAAFQPPPAPPDLSAY